MSRKVTIKELAAILNVSVPTLRKYGECGLLGVDSVAGRTNLFDEEAAVARVQEINRLKSRGYSLSLIRDRLEERPKNFTPLDMGLDGPSFSTGRHVLLVLEDLDEYMRIAQSFVNNGLRGGQAVVLVVHPHHREAIEAMIRKDGHDIEALVRTRQLTFTWYNSFAPFDGVRQVEAFDNTIREVAGAGWRAIRFLGHPDVDPGSLTEAVLHAYEERVSAWARTLAILVICPWIAPQGSAKLLLRMQRSHKEFVCGDAVYVRAS